MFLGLSRYNCVFFEVNGVTDIPSRPEKLVPDVIESNFHTVDGLDVSPFVSQFRSGDQLERSLAVLRRIESEGSKRYIVRVVNEKVELPRLTTHDTPSTRVFLDIASEWLGKIGVTCNARFEYSRHDGFESRIPLPTPIIFPDDDGVTHIEGIQVSRRKARDIEYSIVVTRSTDGDTLFHHIEFQSESEFDRPSLRDLRTFCARASKRLVVQEKNSHA